MPEKNLFHLLFKKSVKPTLGKVAGKGSQAERAITPANERDVVNPWKKER